MTKKTWKDNVTLRPLSSEELEEHIKRHEVKMGYKPHPRASKVSLRPLSDEEFASHAIRSTHRQLAEEQARKVKKSLSEATPTQPPLFDASKVASPTQRFMAAKMPEQHPDFPPDNDHEKLAEWANHPKQDWYHGSSTNTLTPEKLDVQKTSPMNLFGRGVYLSSSPSVAHQYSQKAHTPPERDPEDDYEEEEPEEEYDHSPTVYHAKTKFQKLLPTHEVASPEVRDAWSDALGDYGDYGDDEEEDGEEGYGGNGAGKLYKDPETTNGDLYDHINDIEAMNDYPSGIADEFNSNLQSRHGYDGVYHYGDNGWNTGHAHMIAAFHDPGNRIPHFKPRKK